MDTWERVREGFWYLRIPGVARRVIPVTLELKDATLLATASFAPPPSTRAEDAYRYLLRRNAEARGAAFALDREGTVTVVGRLDASALDDAALESLLGRIVDLVESAFRSYMSIAYAGRYRMT